MRHLLVLDTDDPTSAAARAARETLTRLGRKAAPGGVRCARLGSAEGAAGAFEGTVALVSGGERGVARLAELLEALPPAALVGKAILPVLVAGRGTAVPAEGLARLGAALKTRGAAIFEPVTLDPAQVYVEHGGLFRVSPEFEAGLRAGLTALLQLPAGRPGADTVH